MLPQQATAHYVSKSSAKYAINLGYFGSGILYALKNVEFIYLLKEKAFQSYRMWLDDKVLCKKNKG